MTTNLKISIITPSLNQGAFIPDAIASVACQDYPHIEHIIIDGGSSDNTCDILKAKSHLKWLSEPDRNQSHAMNKGFKLASGDVIGYLNADDYYLPGIFPLVMAEFAQGARFVVGQVKILLGNGFYRINNGKVSHLEMLKHWQPDAYCVNSAGYFFRRDVLEKIGGFNEQNNLTMDLEFLLDASKYCHFNKIDHVLCVFRYHQHGITYHAARGKQYWTFATFAYIDRFVADMDAPMARRYNAQRARGYMLKRLWQRASCVLENLAGPNNTWRRRVITRSRIALRAWYLALKNKSTLTL